jgi:hypothetical protein
VLRRKFGPDRQGVTGGLRKWNNQELHNLWAYSLPDIIRVVKSRRMRWTGYVASVGETKMHMAFGKKIRRQEPIWKI